MRLESFNMGTKERCGLSRRDRIVVDKLDLDPVECVPRGGLVLEVNFWMRSAGR